MRTNLAEDPKLARAHFDIGNYFLYNTKDSASALEIHEYNVEHYTSVFESMWSQAALVWYYVRHSEQANADVEYSKLLAIYHDQKTLPKEVFQIGDIYLEVGDSLKARSLYNQVMDEWPSSEYVFNARAGLIKADIFDGSDTTVMTDINDLITDYKDKSELPFTVFQFGEQYWKMANDEFQKTNPELLGRNSVPNEAMKNKLLQAKTVWEKIINQLPDSDTKIQAYKFAAMCLQDLDNKEQAIAYYQTVIDKWPEYQDADYCQFMIGRLYSSLCMLGIITDSERDVKTEETYKQLVDNYPNSPYAKMAQKWLKSYEKRNAPEKVTQNSEEAWDLLSKSSLDKKN